MEAYPGEREDEVKQYEAWADRAEMECRRWRRLTCWFFLLSVCFVGVSISQNRTIVKQRALIRQLWQDYVACHSSVATLDQRR